MKVYTLERELRVPRPLDELFPFFERPENLQHLTPPWARMQILTPSPIPMHVGSAIDYIVRIHGIPLRWTTLITDYAPPHRFVDIQLRGPYALWHHTHTFEAAGSDTIMRDSVRYALPFGPLGTFARTVLVKHDLDRIFTFREAAIRARFA